MNFEHYEKLMKTVEELKAEVVELREEVAATKRYVKGIEPVAVVDLTPLSARIKKLESVEMPIVDLSGIESRLTKIESAAPIKTDKISDIVTRAYIDNLYKGGK